MISQGLIERLYECASIRRWNDHIRPVEFTELDKQAHKMIIAYILARFEDGDVRPGHVDWIRLIEGAIFEMLHRIILTDIKPPVFHTMMHEKGPELNEWVLQNLESEVRSVKSGFQERFRRYLFEPEFSRAEKRLLKAAHYLATQWEFNVIYKVCPFVYGIERTKEEIENQLEDYYDLKGIQKIALGRKAAGFVSLCGQLRFQRRWSQSPRIPETSVLGHMLIVAVMTYLALREMEACDARVRNGFLAALFHDLPEILTRDITSPVKGAVEGLEDIIKEYERRQLAERLLPLLPPSWHPEILYYTEDEFENRVLIDGQVRKPISIEDMNSVYDHAGAQPIDGEVIRACDHLAAFVEASLSIRHGINSKHLEEGKRRLLKRYRDKFVGRVDFGALFASFSYET